MFTKTHLHTFSNTLQTTQETEATSACWIDVPILDVNHRIEFLKIRDRLTKATIEQYNSDARCGFVLYQRDMVLTFDLRKNTTPEMTKDLSVVIIDARRNGTVMPIGFVVDSMSDIIAFIN